MSKYIRFCEQENSKEQNKYFLFYYMYKLHNPYFVICVNFVFLYSYLYAILYG